MAYVLDDDWDNEPRVVRAGTAGFGLYARCGMWVARHLTDGFVPAEVAAIYGTREWVAKLVDVGLWTAVDGGYHMPDYLILNQSAEKVRARRLLNTRRQALFRDPELRRFVRERDRDLCRYCGVKVRWNDRKGARGGTYDHVDPNGPNAPENLVVSCRGCNSSKKDRTPEQAGMTLLPPPVIQNGSRSDLVSSRTHSLPSKEGKGAGEAPRPLPPWCGRCNKSTRMDVADDGRSIPCGACHPSRTNRTNNAGRVSLPYRREEDPWTG